MNAGMLAALGIVALCAGGAAATGDPDPYKAPHPPPHVACDMVCQMDRDQLAAQRRYGRGGAAVIRACAARVRGLAHVSYRFDLPEAAWWVNAAGPARALDALRACIRGRGVRLAPAIRSIPSARVVP